jgi:carboxypeptidase Taq
MQNIAVPDALAGLSTLLKRSHTLDTVTELLGWDEQVNLPPGGAELRAEQLSALAGAAHAAAGDARIGRQIATLEKNVEKLSPAERATVRWARRDYDRATKLPAAFVSEKAAQLSRAYHAWADARAKGDFTAYAPVLAKNIELVRREAAYLGHGGSGDEAYDYMIDRHDPGMNAAVTGKLLDGLKAGLVPFARRITSSPVKARKGLLRGCPAEKQKAFLREVTERIGFDYNHGRIDVSPHPFCSGTGDDIRMTTRYDADNPLDSLFSAIHEAGHGIYEQGLPAGLRHTAPGQAAGMGVHESQSRLWENQVARSRGFWRYFEPGFREAFAEQTHAISTDELYLAINAVAPTPIRVDADEVTYNLHIILRFEMEKKLFSGMLAVDDLPRAWNAASRELLGLEPGNDREGVLQDVHWSGASFGYFPSYCIGNMVAAQLWHAALAEHPAMEDDFARGDFSWLLGWLRAKVHSQGKQHDTPGLVRFATGDGLSPKWLLRYLEERYAPLYL